MADKSSVHTSTSEDPIKSTLSTTLAPELSQGSGESITICFSEDSLPIERIMALITTIERS
jgi:hypothetical protein